MTGLELPYAVQGMDLAFSGVMTAACRLVGWSSLRRMLVASRACFRCLYRGCRKGTCHTGKTELLLGG